MDHSLGHLALRKVHQETDRSQTADEEERTNAALITQPPPEAAMAQSNSNSSSTPQPPSSTGKPKLKPTLSTKLPPFNDAANDADDEDSSDRTKLLDKTRSLSMAKRGPSNYEEACSIWNMGWKVSLATFCRISLSSISAAFLGHLGSDALAASALAMIWTNGVQILIFGFAVSLCTMCGQAYGAKNFELVGIWLQLGLIFLTLFSIPVMISFFYVDHLLSFVTDDLEVLHLADTYARYLVPTVLPQAVYCALRQYLQAQEIVTPATIISILSVGVCLVSNYVFIYGFGPIPALHFIGSPIAQCVASIFQPVALYVYAFWYKGYHKKTWYGFKVEECLQWERVKYFISLSLGMTLNLALDEWVYNAVSSLAGSMGAMNLAANSVMFNLWGLVFAIYWGFGLPTQVRAANFLGANEPALAQQTLRVGFVLGGIAAALSALFVFIFRHWIISVFTPDLEVAVIINHTLPVFCLAVFVSGLHIILAAVVEAMSLASTLVRITCTGSWLVLLPSSYLLGVVWDGGLQGLWWGSVLGEGTKFVLMAYALLRIDWTEMALRAVKQSEGNVLDEQEMEEDVEFRASFMSATTPTMSGRSPVVTIFSAPQQVHHHRKDQHGSDMEEGVKFRSSSYGTTE